MPMVNIMEDVIKGTTIALDDWTYDGALHTALFYTMINVKSIMRLQTLFWMKGIHYR